MESTDYQQDEAQAKVKYGFIDLYHAKRRREILKSHPEIRELMRIDPSFKYVSVFCAVTQLAVAYFLRDECLLFVIFMGIFVGSLFDCAITNSVHELVHDLAVEGNPTANKALSIVANSACVLPFAAGYHRSHRHHHAYLGTDMDAKYPTIEEASKYDQDTFSRLKYIFTHPRHGGKRWERIAPGDKPTNYAVWNERIVWVVDVIVLIFFGYKSIVYLFVSYWTNDTIFVQGSKNYVDHWVSESATYTSSYYGWFNMVNFNIGYHREHHDFPNIPGRYLAMVYKIAPEFYEDERYIAKNLFSAVWDILRAKPGQGLMKHANKLTVKEVKVD